MLIPQTLASRTNSCMPVNVGLRSISGSLKERFSVTFKSKRPFVSGEGLHDDLQLMIGGMKVIS